MKRFKSYGSVLALLLLLGLVLSGCGSKQKGQQPPADVPTPTTPAPVTPPATTPPPTPTPAPTPDPVAHAYAPFSVTMQWGGGQTGVTLTATGRTTVPDVHVDVVKDGKVVQKADTEVHDDWFRFFLGDARGAELVFSTPDGQELGRWQADAQASVGPSASVNFKEVWARRVDANTISVQGRARVFEAQFRVAIWHEGKVLAIQPVKADAGAPEFGQFSVTFHVPGGVPEGAEAWCIIDSAKDGTPHADLMTPITADK